MELLVFGINHTTAPISVRERWAVSAEQSRACLSQLRNGVHPSEHLILSTCNRTEFYSRIPVTKSPVRTSDDPVEQRAAMARLCFGPTRDIADSDLQHAYLYRERSAVEHLFRVAGGLDSMIVGESEIIRQIKDALAVSREARTMGDFFQRLFDAALRTGKRVRSETGIADGCITPGQAALNLARECLGDLSSQRVLLMGSGKIATLTARALLDAGVSEFEIVNRTSARAEELASRLKPSGVDVRISGPDRLDDALTRASLVISSTGSTEPLVDAGRLEAVQRQRDYAPWLAVDLAIPRDFAPEAGSVRGVSLFNIDDLNGVIHENIAERHRHVPVAEEIVRDQIGAFVGRMAYYLQVDPVIRHMFERFEEIRLGEMQRAVDQLPSEYHEHLDAITRSLVAKLIHFPISRLKSLRDLGGLSDAEVMFFKKMFPTDPS